MLLRNLRQVQRGDRAPAPLQRKANILPYPTQLGSIASSVPYGLPAPFFDIELYMRMSPSKAIVAFLIAPLVGPAVLALAGAFSPGPFSLGEFGGLFVLFALYSLPLIYLIALLLGIPAWLYFRHHQIRAWSAFVATGAVLGVIFHFTFEAVNGHFHRYSFERVLTRVLIEFIPFSSPFLWINISLGVATAILFRAIALPLQSRETAP
jgi:hypothetical protein